jgi:parallel beta-helix repeat protein
MKMKTVLQIVFIAFLTGILTLTTNIQPTQAPNGFGYIYIRANGAIDPPDAPISTGDNVTYFLIENIVNKSIVVERDNIILNGRGFTVSGPEGEGSIGINVTSRNNVTIKNTNIEKFDIGIYTVYSTKITLTGNNASNNKILVFMPPIDFYWIGTGISVSRSNETILFNNTVSNNIFGIYIYESNNTRVDGNNVSDNRQFEDPTWYGIGIYLSESKNSTVVDNTVSNNGAMGISVSSGTMGYPCFNNTIRNNTISGHDFGAYSYGLYVSWSRDNTIVENSIFSNIYGVYVRYYSQHQIIINNNVSLNVWGIYLDSSTNNTIINNTLFKNVDGITFENDANHNKILYNTISNTTSFGIYIRKYSRNNVVLGNNLLNNARGVRFTESNNNSIFGNIISSSTYDGLVIYYYSSNNEVVSNNISSNDKGITLTYDCYNTKIFHNNFIENTEHVYTDMNTTWDDGYPSGGNYWSNYTGADIKSGISQDETGSDGIGDTAHIVSSGNNTDRYPLMAPINTFDAGIWGGTTFYVEVISNSTVSNFKMNIAEKTISFNVTGETGSGFCRVIIPKIIVEALWLNNYTVLVNGLSVEFKNWTDAKNTYIYFTYPHSKQEVIIIPEFPYALLLPFLMMFATFAVILTKKRVHKEISH